MERLREIWQNPLQRLALLSGLIIIVVVFFISFLSITCSPTFCTTVCHSMKKIGEAWKKSSHSEIPCLSCHVEPGFFNLIKDKILVYKEPILEITGRYEKPINKESELSKELKDEICIQCHSENRNYTPSNGIKINHEAHQKIHLNCARCHNRVGHATKDHENHLKEKWCIKECHKSKALSLKCSVCHTDEFIEKNKDKIKEKGKEFEKIKGKGGEEEE